MVTLSLSTDSASAAWRARPESPQPDAGEVEFPRFNDLPLELRWRIWEYLLPGPRIVELRESYKPQNQTPGTEGPGTWREIYDDPGSRTMCTPLQSPILLRVCRESADVARRHYRTAFHQELSSPTTSTVYFDFDRDFLYISRNTFSHRGFPSDASPLGDITFFRKGDASKVKRLVLEPDMLRLCEIITYDGGDPESLYTAHFGQELSLCDENDWRGIEVEDFEMLWSLLSVLRTFCNVEELFFVIDDRSNKLSGTSWPSGDHDEPVFAEPISVFDAFLHYTDVELVEAVQNHQTSYSSGESKILQDLIDKNDAYEDYKFDVSETHIDDIFGQLTDVNEARDRVSKPRFTLPKIRVNSIASTEQLRQVDRAKESYYELLENAITNTTMRLKQFRRHRKRNAARSLTMNVHGNQLQPSGVENWTESADDGSGGDTDEDSWDSLDGSDEFEEGEEGEVQYGDEEHDETGSSQIEGEEEPDFHTEA